MSHGARHSVFVDGQAGTTGLQIVERLERRDDIQLLAISPELRKDAAERARCINAADFVILCLPDAAARSALSLVRDDNLHTRILDASTAHRTAPDWAYGIPELSPQQRALIASAQRVAVPGCHASGFALLVYPLIQAGLLSRDALLSVHSITGYSGGGKQMIADYEAPEASPSLRGSRPYALALDHKHLPEMQCVTGLASPPVFQPIVCNFYQGMIVSVPLHCGQLSPSAANTPAQAQDVHAALSAHYTASRFVRVNPFETSPSVGPLDPQANNGTNQVDLFVFGAPGRMMLCARYDNLGKGASGAAVQCLNLMLGVDEATSL